MSRHNPVGMLQDTPPRYFERAATNPEFLRRYDIIMHPVPAVHGPEDELNASNFLLARVPLTIRLPLSRIWSAPRTSVLRGGLGVLAGDHIEPASDPACRRSLSGSCMPRLSSPAYRGERVAKNVAEILDRDAAPVLRLSTISRQLVVQVPLSTSPSTLRSGRCRWGVSLHLLDTISMRTF